MVKTYCTRCEKLTLSLRRGRAFWVCEICSHNKTLSDVYYLEAVEKKKKLKPIELMIKLKNGKVIPFKKYSVTMHKQQEKLLDEKK